MVTTERYFAIAGLSTTPERPLGLFRELSFGSTSRLERFDPTSSNWVPDRTALEDYLFKGEPGCTEITFEAAQKLSREAFPIAK